MDTANKQVNMDTVDINQMIAYEEGALDDVETIAFFQGGISGGWIWHLQGHYARTACTLIELGYCTVQQTTIPTTPSNVGATT